MKTRSNYQAIKKMKKAGAYQKYVPAQHPMLSHSKHQYPKI
jgi:hypothetical protein